MDYRKYLKEGFQLKEFTNIKDGQDMGELWHKADELGKSLKAKVDNKEPLTDEDKKELNNVIHTGEEYLNALKANFAVDPEGGSPIERECAGLVDGKESIEDHLRVYKELLNNKADNSEASSTEDNEVPESPLVDIIKDALQSKSPDIVAYLNARDTYNALATGTGADISNDKVASALAILNDAFNVVNKNLGLSLDNTAQLDKILDEIQSKISITASDAEAEDTDADAELDEVAEAKEDAFRAYYFIYKSENNARIEYANALRSNNPEAVQNAENKKNQLIKAKTDTLTKYLEIVNTTIEHVNAENRMKGDISEPKIAKIATIKDLEEELLKYFSDPTYAEVKELVEQEILGDEAQEALVEGDPSKITTLANTFSATFKTEQDVEVWKKCILRYAKLLAAYNAMMKNAVDAGLIPSKLEDIQKYVRYASLAVTIASFIPPLNAATLPLKIASGSLRFAGGVTTTILQGKKSIEAFKNGNPKEGVMRLFGAGLGAFSAYSGFMKLKAGISDLQTYNMFKPENLAKIDFAAENTKIDEQLSALKNTNGGPLTTDAADKIAALEAKKELLGTQQNMYLLSTNPETAQQCNEQLRNIFNGKISKSELTGYINNTQRGVEEAAKLAAESVQQEIAETAMDNAMDQLPPNPLEALQNMPEAEAREMANKWAANGGWYANVMASGTEEDKVKAIYALKAINNSADGQAQIAMYKELGKVSANISNADKLLNGAGGYFSQQADLYADVSKNVDGSLYNNLGKAFGRDVALDDVQRHNITSSLYDACTTNGSDSQITVGQVQKILTDNNVTSMDDQRKCLQSIFKDYKPGMEPSTALLKPKDTYMFERITQVQNGDLSGLQGKIINQGYQNVYNDLGSALHNRINTIQGNLSDLQAKQADLSRRALGR